MIVLGERNEKGDNILHIIIGPETEGQFNFSGQSVMEIGEYLKRMDSNKPCHLIVNRCDSEEEVLNMMAFQEGQRQAKNVIDKIQQRLNKNRPSDFENPFDSEENNGSSKKKPSLKSEDKKTNGIKCPLCFQKDSAVILDGMVYPCKKCQEIERGLHAQEIPEIPSTDKLEDIRKEIEGQYPEQRSSIARFLNEDQNEEEDDEIDEEDEVTDGDDSDI